MTNASVNGIDDLFILKEILNSIREEINLLRWPPKEQQNQNAFFHCFMALFIFLMQCGFAFLEAGAVRAKNITNILTKNVLDSLITIISYWSVGWALAYGPNANEALSGFFGWSQFLGFGLVNFSRFFFQYVFAARASTIISGAVAERAEFTTFLAYSLFVPAIVYPILTHWGWSDQGWLARGIRVDSSNYRTTYMDFAGAGVVHLCGGTISLVAACMIGPRVGRFSPDGHATRIEGHSVPLASLGGFILMLGFLAFNGGSAVDVARPGSGQLVAKAMVITLICGAFAAIIVLIEHKFRHDKWTVLLTMNGCLTGMISSCAGCNQMDMWGTVITGMGGGLFYIGFSELLLKLRIDDPLDAFAVHAGGGLWGLISVCIVSNQPGRGLIYALFSGSLTTLVHALMQFGWQLLAAIVIILWSGLLVIPLFGFLKLIHKFRVPDDIERKGIDIWKHGEDAYPLVAYGHGWDELEGNIEQMFDQHGVEQKLKAKMQHPSTNATTSPRYVATIWHDPDRYGTINRRLIVCTLTYLMVGSAVFDALESEAELKQRQQVETIKKRLVSKYNISSADFRLLESIIVRAIPHKAGHQWKFGGAFYFATTVITTIGYGHSCPVTMGGKIFCMFYALAGIPLGLVMFQSIGERLNTFCSILLRRVKYFFGRPPLVSPMDLIVVCSLLSSACIAVGAWVFSQYEGWPYFDSVYYCFITLVTIGFGDFVALQKDDALEKRPEYVLFVLFFIVFGLAVISAAMNLLVLRFLTLNTEDEKRDKREAKLAAKGLVTIDSLGRRHYMKSRESSSSSSSSPSRSQQQAEPRSGPPSDDEGETSEGFRTRTATGGSCASLRKRQKLTLAQSLFTPLLPLSGLKGLESDSASIVSCSCYQLAKTGTVLQSQQQPQQGTTMPLHASKIEK